MRVQQLGLLKSILKNLCDKLNLVDGIEGIEYWTPYQSSLRFIIPLEWKLQHVLVSQPVSGENISYDPGSQYAASFVSIKLICVTFYFNVQPLLGDIDTESEDILYEYVLEKSEKQM